MRQPSGFEQIRDLFLLRLKAPDYAEDKPYYTTGSIISAGILRGVVILLVFLFFNDTYHDATWWWPSLMLSMWGICVYPAYLQYTRFNESVNEILEGTLCGVCRHFNPTSQLCTILDEHVTSDEPPCGGEAWEPIPS